MNFLEKLYNQEYFAPILFGVIVVLAVAFVIVLILALRDLKKESAGKDNKSNSLNNETITDEFIEQNVKPFDVQAPINQMPQNPMNMGMVNGNIPSMQNPNMNYNQTLMQTPDMMYNNQQVQPMQNPYGMPMQGVAPTPQMMPQNPMMQNNIGPVPQTNSVETQAEAEQAANDLDAIANTLLAEYKKENQEEVAPQVQNEAPSQDQFSSVYVTSDTIPEQNSVSNMPNLADIPTPQPVRVVNSSNIIDSSASANNNADNIPNEEYHI